MKLALSPSALVSSAGKAISGNFTALISGGGARSRQIRRAVVSSGFARVVGIIASLAQVPIALSYLGTEAFGLWMVLVGTVQLLNFADLGVGLGVQNYISTALGRDDVQEVKNAITTGTVLLGILGISLAAIALPACWLFPWADYLGVVDPILRGEVTPSLAIIVVYFAFGLPIGIGMRYAVGMQNGWWVGLWASIGSGVGLFAVWLAKILALPFSGFMAMAMLPGLFSGLGVYLMMTQSLAKHRKERGRCVKALFSSLLGQGGLFLIPQICAAVMNAAPAVILSSLLGPAAVAPLSICQRVINALLQVQSIPMQPLWPAYAEAISRGDSHWIGRIKRKALMFSIVLGGLGSSAFLLFGEKIIFLWTGSTVTIPVGVLYGFTFWFFIVSITSPLTIHLNAAGRLKSQAVGGVLTTITLLLILPKMVCVFGVSGATFAMLISWGLLTFPLVVLDYNKKLRNS